MYLWVILATFITILYSYNLSVRPDLDRVHAESKASVFIAKFRAQQNALKECFSAKQTSRTGLTSVPYYPGDGINSSTGNDWSGDTDFTAALPAGYHLETGDNVPISKVFCFYDENYATNCSSATPAAPSCCSGEYTGIYVVSFQKIPSRWYNKAVSKPNTDLISAMSKIGGYGNSLGYTTKQDGKFILSGGRQVVTSYTTETDEDGNPVQNENKAFEFREIFPGIQNDPDFKETCDKEKTHCIFAIQQIYG